MTTFQLAILCAFVLSSGVGAFFWGQAKFLLRAKGFPVSFSYRGHMKDLFYMKELAHSERNPVRREKIHRLRICMAAFLAASLILIAILGTTAACSLLSQS